MSLPAFEHSSNFVLVHGAWHGGWCWKRVVPLLRAYAGASRCMLHGKELFLNRFDAGHIAIERDVAIQK